MGIGINDIGHGFTIEQFAKNYEEILRHVEAATQAAIVVTNILTFRVPSGVGVDTDGVIDARFNERLEEIARRHEVTIFTFSQSRAAFPSHPSIFKRRLSSFR